MSTARVSFRNRGGQRLAALLDRPAEGEPTAYALFAHCFTCSKDYKAVSRVSRAIAAEGVAVLRFDFTGLGESEGEFSSTTFSSNLDDLVAAAEFLTREFGPPVLLIGHSLGGAAVLKAASRIASARAVATIAAPSSPAHLLRHLRPAIAEIERRGEAMIELGGRPFAIRRELLDDLSQSSLRDAIGNLERPLLIFHSPADSVVGIDNASEIFVAARHPKSFVSLDSADHLLSNSQDAAFVGAVIAAWSRRYLGSTRT